jgi:hypothetical protein
MNYELSAEVVSYELDMLAQGRENLVGLISQLSEKQVNLIPSGFKNNLIWNFGHIIVSHQILCYKYSGLDPVVSEAKIDQFKRGTVPVNPLDQDQINQLKIQAVEAVTRFKEDYQTGIFKEYQSYQSLYGVTLNSIEDAIVFNNTHEGIHLGYMMAMKKALTK